MCLTLTVCAPSFALIDFGQCQEVVASRALLARVRLLDSTDENEQYCQVNYKEDFWHKDLALEKIPKPPDFVNKKEATWVRASGEFGNVIL